MRLSLYENGKNVYEKSCFTALHFIKEIIPRKNDHIQNICLFSKLNLKVAIPSLKLNKDSRVVAVAIDISN